MLFSITSIVDYLGLCIALWLAFYLLARGFPSSITLRTVVVLLAISTFFFSAFVNLRMQVPGATNMRAVLLVVALSTLHDLTNKLLPESIQKKNAVFVYALYILGWVTIGLLFATRGVFANETGNILFVGRMNRGLIYVLYAVFQVLVDLGILNNFRLGAKLGIGTQNRYFLIAALLAIGTTVYGVLALALSPPMPRVIQDALMLGSIVLLGLSVARHQTLIERRTTLQDFPVSFLATLGLSAVFAILAWIWSGSAVIVALITALAILTHAVYDLSREFLDRLQRHEDSQFRRQLRTLEHRAPQDQPLQDLLHEGLVLLCQLIGASGGFIAVRESETFTVAATHHSLDISREFPSAELTCDELYQPHTDTLKDITWIAPVFEENDQVAVIGVQVPRAKNKYSTDDLDLLGEVADHLGGLVHPQAARPGGTGRRKGEDPGDLSQAADLRASSEELITTLVTNPDPEFVKLVEDGLRNLSDIVTLGGSPLAKVLEIRDETEIERGKVLQKRLKQAIEVLKPEKPRPPEPLPREWYSYAVLHDAYIEDVPNREIMARLYISEGTFNRSRRHALRGVARYLLEENRKT